MLYDAYERKIKKVAKVKRFALRNKILLISIVSVIVALTSGYLFSKGTVTSIDYTPEITYGETISVQGNAMFEDVSYEFYDKTTGKWTTTAPTTPGTYKVRVLSTSIFGNTRYGKEKEIVIKPKNLILEIASDEVVYGEKPEIIETGLINDDYIESVSFIYNDYSSTNPLVKVDKNNTHILTKDNKNITYGYSINPVETNIKILPRDLEITFSDKVGIYDSFPLTSEDYAISAGTLAENDEIVMSEYQANTPAGVIENFAKINILHTLTDGTKVDVTNQYNIKTITGTLEVLKRDITIKTGSSTKTYDGINLTDEFYEITSGTLVEGHHINILSSSKIKNVGTCTNELEIQILDKDNNDVTSNYNITFDLGTLEILARHITIKTNTSSKVYDDQIYFDEAYEITVGTLGNNHKINVISKTEILNVSSVDNVLEVAIFDEEDIDVTQNYVITYEYGTIELTPRPMLIKPCDVEKIYDASELVANSAQILLDSNQPEYLDIVDGHTLHTTFEGSIVNVGVTNSSISSYKIFDGDVDVTSNYIVTTVLGEIKITPRPIIIKPVDLQKVYDGLELVAENAISFIPTENQDEYLLIVEGHEIKAKFIGSITNVGIINSEIESFEIFSGENNLTSNYLVTLEKGSLEITPRPIIIKPVDETKVYDGLELVASVSEVDLSSEYILVEGHSISSTYLGSIINVGSTESEIETYQILNGTEDVTNNYSITCVKGVLEVTPRPIIIKPVDEVKVYDDTDLIPVNFEYTQESQYLLVDGHNISLDYIGSIRNVGIESSLIDDKTIKIENGTEDVTQNYSIVTVPGQLEITPRPITIETGTSIKMYDGNELVNSLYSIIDGTLVTGHIIDCYDFNNPINVGIHDNTVSVKIENTEGDVTSNYDITFDHGTLEIRLRPITIKPVDEVKVYDGVYYEASNVELALSSENDIVSGHVITATYEGTIKNVGVTNSNIVTYQIFNGTEDVTSNYLVTLEKGKLEITPRLITITYGNIIYIYDGLGQYYDDYVVSSGTIAENQILECFDFTTQINVGVYDNLSSYRILDNEEDVTSNYLVTLEEGLLEITPRPVTLKPVDETKVYDGLPLEASQTEVSGTSSFDLVEGHEVVSTYEGSIVNVGYINSNILTYQIFNGTEDVTSNYLVTLEEGLLEVTPRPITVQSASGTRVYDGTAFEIKEATIIEGTLVEGQNIEYTFYNSIIDVGVISNDFGVNIYNGMEDVTYNYSITFNCGLLEVTPRPIIIKPVDEIKVYDATTLYPSEAEVSPNSEYGLVLDHYIDASFTGHILEVGVRESLIFSYAILSSGVDLTYNYSVTLEEGKLEITPRPITITSDSASKVYDGTYLYQQSYSYDEGKISWHNVSGYDFNSILNVGTVQNTFKANIYEYGIDVTHNYDITLVYGTLEIIPRPITIKPVDEIKIYDGYSLTASSFELSTSSLYDLVSNHVIEGTFGGSITNVGVTNSNIESYIIYSGMEDVTSNYLVTLEEGLLEITPRPVTLKPVDETKVYDGLPLEASQTEVSGTSSFDLVEGHEVVSTYEGSIVNVGYINSNILTYQIFNGTEDVTSNYLVTLEEGLLEVTPRPITIKSESYTFEYDGLVHDFKTASIIQGTLVEGQRIEYYYSGYVYVGTYEHFVGCDIVDEYWNYYSHNYEISYEYGIVEVTPRPITISTGSGTKVYDGYSLVCPIAEITEGSLVNDQTLEYYNFTEEVNVGTYDNYASCYIYENESEISWNYSITVIPGVLEITPRDVHIRTNSGVFVYDEEGIELREFEIVSGSVADRDLLMGDGFQKFYNVGIYENVAVFYIFNGPEDVGYNYNLTVEFGTVEITHKEITLKPKDEIKSYDGNPLFATELTEDSKASINENQIAVTFGGSQTNVGVSNSYISSVFIYNTYGENVTTNYIITLLEGKLEVVLSTIFVESFDASKEYDGTPLECPDYEVSGDIENCHVEVLMTGSQTEIGSSDNTFEVYVYDDYGNDISSNYSIVCEYGELIVTKYILYIKSLDAKKEYDGSPLKCEAYEQTGLRDGYYLDVTFTGYQTIIGESLNTFEVKVYDSYGNLKSSDYDINYKYGKLKVYYKEITIKTHSAYKVYDGLPLVYSSYECEGLIEGHRLDVNITGIQTEVGQSKNTFEVTIYNQYDEDVTLQYSIVKEYGVLTVYDQILTIESLSATKQYDGTPLTCEEYFIQGDIGNVRIDVFFNGSQTEIGSSDNTFTYALYDEYGNDVTDLYAVECKFGELKVIGGTLYVTTGSDKKTFDGTPLYCHEYMIEGLQKNHEAKVVFLNKIVKPGKINNRISLEIFDEYGNVLTDYYDVIYEYGRLEILPIVLQIETESDEKEYDGTPLTNSNYVIEGTPVSNHFIIVNVFGSQTEIGSSNNDFSYQILDENGVDVSYGYDVTTKPGILQVHKIKVYIITSSAQKIYDGEPLTCHEYTVENLPEQYKEDLDVIGTITEVGFVYNEAVLNGIIDINTNQYVDELPYHEIVLEFGSLQVIESFGSAGGGTGAIDGPSFNEDAVTVLEVLADVTSTVYLRERSFGDYTLTDGFKDNIAPYTEGSINALFLTNQALIDSGKYYEDNITIKSVVDGSAYFTPYYTIDNMDYNKNDVKVVGENASLYSTTFINYDYSQKGKVKQTNPKYVQEELAYRDYVYDNYLSLPASTKASMLDIIYEEGINKNSPTIINDVKKYIQNAAEYDLYFTPEENSDSVIYFLTSSKRGVCRHFASAATVMYRALGIPARYVIGYMADTKANEWTKVTSKQYHAWVEVYIDGQGWVQLEVTGGGPGGSGGSGGSGGGLNEPKEDKNQISISTASETKIYDTQPLVNQSYILLGKLNDGDYEVVNVTGYIDYIGRVENTADVTIYNKYGEDVTDNYDINLEFGDLIIQSPSEVKPILELTAASGTFTYDGTRKVYNKIKYDKESLPSGYKVTGQVESEGSNAGEHFSNIVKDSVVITDENGNDVTSNYELIFNPGTVTIKKVNLTIKIEDAAKVYDGKVLTSSNYSIISGSLKNNNKIVMVFEEGITQPGVKEITPSKYYIVDSNNVNMSDNYQITIIPGTLTVYESED